MATSANALRAGRANIELSLGGKKQVLGALESLQNRARAMSRNMLRIGAAGLAAGTAITAPILAAAKTFSAAGDVIHKMSARTGVAADVLSQMGFAAEQSGSNVEQLGNALFRMGRRVANASTGGGPAVHALEALGLKATELTKLSPDQQLLAIADAMKNVSNESLAAQYGFEIFGNGARSLLPLLQEGSTGIEKLMRQADELGLTMSTEDVNAAARLGDAINSVTRQMKAFTFQIGAAVAGPMAKLLEAATSIGSAFITLARNNRALVAATAAVGVAIAAAGATFIALGASLGVAAFSLGAIGSVFAFIASPAGILAVKIAAITAAVLGGTGAFFKYTQAGRDMGATLRQTFSGVANALSGGQLKLAMEIGIGGMRLAFLSGIQGMRLAWSDFVNDILSAAITIGARLEGLFSGDPAGVASDMFGALGVIDAKREADAAAIIASTAGARAELDSLLRKNTTELQRMEQAAGAGLGDIGDPTGGAGIYTPGGVFDTRFAKQIFAGPQDQQVQLLGKIERNTRQRPGGIEVA